LTAQMHRYFDAGKTNTKAYGSVEDQGTVL
jgi:hypothetical protein